MTEVRKHCDKSRLRHGAEHRGDRNTAARGQRAEKELESMLS